MHIILYIISYLCCANFGLIVTLEKGQSGSRLTITYQAAMVQSTLKRNYYVILPLKALFSLL